VLIDGDVDNPRLGSQLGVSPTHGWEATISGDASLEDCCISSLRDCFTILPLMDEGVDFVDTESSTSMRTTLTKLSEKFDVVLIDAGPGSQIWDHPSVADQVGIVIVQDRRRPETDVQDFANRMKRRSTTVLGLIENFSKAA